MFSWSGGSREERDGRVILETDSQLVKLAESNSFALAAMGGVVYELRASTTV